MICEKVTTTYLRLFIYIYIYIYILHTVLRRLTKVFVQYAFLEIALKHVFHIILFVHPVYPKFKLDSAIRFQEYDMDSDMQNESYSYFAYTLSKNAQRIQPYKQTYTRKCEIICEIISVHLWCIVKLQDCWWWNISSLNISCGAQQLLSEDHILLSKLAKRQNSFVIFAINSVIRKETIYIAFATFLLTAEIFFMDVHGPKDNAYSAGLAYRRRL